MNPNGTMWITLAIAIAVFIAFVLRKFVKRPSVQTIQTRSAWAIAATIALMTTVSIGTTVIDLVRKVTVVDIVALAATALLAGLFLGFSLAPQRPNV